MLTVLIACVCPSMRSGVQMGWRVSDVLQAKGRVFTCRMSWLLKTLLGSGHPCLFVGESGTSKSVTIASYLSGLDSSHLTLNMNFSSRTSSLDVQHAIEDSIEKRTKVGVRVPTVQTATAPSWLV